MQQCICAIELIGLRFFETDAEIKASCARMRDELLATTEAGRAWVALFERAQLPLLTTLMEDEKLSAQAAELVKSAAELTKSDRKRLRDESIDAAIQVVRALARPPRPRTFAPTCAPSSAGSKPCAG